MEASLEMETPAQKCYSISGMSCGHCGAAVTDQVQELPGVDTAAVDLESATLTVRGEAIDDRAIREAVAEAGYQVVSP